ncbi:hypothetical protein [Clostridium sp.]|uniref:glycosyltransferase n=1 Tax=Clostridium sp. TaxID=1506 RepID=UPI0026121856|nr:hypothetical protein [Clostridium sp.]
MEKLNCKMIIHNVESPHLNQIIAGFVELKKQGLISIDKEIINDSQLSYIEVLINNNIRVIYETQDSGDVFACDFDKDEIDFYFKRSFKCDMKKNISDKIYPLGLNYDVNSKYGDFHSFKYNAKNLLKKMLKKGKNKFYIEDFECENSNCDGKICFLTRFWNPDSEEVENETIRNERININKFRANCIRSCKKKYGNKFLGGAYKDEYSLENYKDCVIFDSSITEREKYLDILKGYDICIATKGLHNSIGWKFAEYVAMGKIIISEPLDYEVPGNFDKNKNYLEFNNVEELIEKIDLIKKDSKLATKLKENNEKYYRDYLRPDKLIINTFKIVFNNRGLDYE